MDNKEWPTFDCGFCPAKFYYEQELVQHYQAYHIFQCTVCAMGFYSEEELRRHVITEHNQNFQEGTDQVYDNIGSANVKSPPNSEEMQTHEGSKRRDYSVNCDKCNIPFKSTWHLKRHLQSKAHTRPEAGLDVDKIKQESTTICPVCSKNFQTAWRLSKHKSVHSTERPFKCGYETCEMTFKRIDSVKLHQLVHTDTKNFICDCGTGFSTIHRLDKHKKTTHSCDECELTYQCYTGLKKHKLDDHSKNVSVTSFENEERYGMGYSDGAHIDNRMNEQPTQYQQTPLGENKPQSLNCECGDMFYTRYDLNRHKKKTYNCDECRSVYQCLNGFRKHKQDEHVKNISVTSIDDKEDKEMDFPDQTKKETTKFLSETFNDTNTTGTFACECGYTCEESSQLSSHKSKIYNCDECESTYQCHTSLQKHRLIAHIRKFPATSFAGEEQHMMHSSNDGSTGDTMSEQNDLIQHRISAKNFVCECGYNTDRMSRLARHRRETYNCKKCDVSFPCNIGFKQHTQKVHNVSTSTTLEASPTTVANEDHPVVDYSLKRVKNEEAPLLNNTLSFSFGQNHGISAKLAEINNILHMINQLIE